MTVCNCNSSSDVACQIFVFNMEQKSHYKQLRSELTCNLNVEETPCGFTFIYPNETSFFLKIAEWVTYENQCCPFINFSLHVSGEAETIRLDLTGSAAVKNLLRQEFNI